MVKKKKKFEFDFSAYNFCEAAVDPYDEYKFVVEMTDKLSERRQKLHSIFETMLTALLALAYFIFRNETLEAWPRKSALVIIALLGISISLVWDGIIKSYKELIDFRFQVLMRMEDQLKNSVRIYRTEWEYFRQKRNSKQPFTFSLRERTLPYAFVIIYLLLGVWGLLMN